MATNGLDFRSEHERAVEVGIEQRLHSKTIAIQEQASLTCVPKRDSEHAVKLVRKSGAVFFVSMNYRFRIAAGPEPVALLLEFSAQFDVVVDLAVEDHMDRLVFV